MVMLQIVRRFSIVSASIGRARVLDGVALHSADAEPADRRQDQVLGGDAVAELAGVEDPHRLRPPLDQALGGEDVLDLRGADARMAKAPKAPWVEVWESPQTIVIPGWVTPELGPDHMDDAPAVGAERVDRDPELLAVGLERLDLLPGELVGDQPRGGGAVGRDVVVGGRQGLVGPADRRDPPRRSPSKACAEVTSWTRWRSM